MLKSTQKISVFLIIYTTVTNAVVNGRSGFWMNKFENCDPHVEYDGILNISITSKENKQYVDGTVILKSPLDNTILSNTSVEMKIGNHYVYLFSIYERKSCDAIHKYYGEFIYELERKAQLIPRMCPIPEGKYHVHNARLDYQKIVTLVNFPLGNLRFTAIGYKKSNIYTCVVSEVENHGYF